MDAPVLREKAAIIGAGVGGLAAAIDLARRGIDVVVLERAAVAGGKMRELRVGGVAIDAGPTVLTMRSVFEQLFQDAGASLEDFLKLEQLQILARHAWSAGERLDLHADPMDTEAAIGEFAGAKEARGYRRFHAAAREAFEILDSTFIRASQPSLIELVARSGVRGLLDMRRIRPFATLWNELGSYFSDTRLRQMFARYATYCGSSPFLAPATLMLVAHVEQEGVWAVEGGMQRLAEALEALAKRLGVTFRYDADVDEIEIRRGRATAVLLRGGERIEAGAIICNADCAALAAGAFGQAASKSLETRKEERSLSALTFALVGKTRGPPLVRHNVFFCEDYAAEFQDIFQSRQLPGAGTVYVCAQDRFDGGNELDGAERLLCLVNAPAIGDRARPNEEEIERCRLGALAMLERQGLHIDHQAIATTGPQEFELMFPKTGGALYGPATHGWRASFTRPGSRTSISNLYLAGGSVHPGAGVPMAAISGRLAAAALLKDLASSAR